MEKNDLVFDIQQSAYLSLAFMAAFWINGQAYIPILGSTVLVLSFLFTHYFRKNVELFVNGKKQHGSE